MQESSLKFLWFVVALVVTILVAALGFALIGIWSFDRQAPGQAPLLWAIPCLLAAAIGQAVIRGTYRRWDLSRHRD